MALSPQLRRTLLQVLWVAAPKVAGGALTLALNLLLMRLWPPAVYGVYAICSTLILLTDAILGSSFDLATLRLAPARRESHPEAARQVERAALLSKALASAALLLLVLLFARPLSLLLFHEPGHATLLVAATLATVALLLFRAALVHAQIEQRFRAYAALESIHSGLKFGGIALWLAFASPPSPLTVLAFFIAGPAIALAAALLWFRRARLWPTAFHPASLRELLHFVRWYALSGGAGNLLGRMDLFFLSALSQPRETGLFAAAQTIAAVLWLLASYLSVVLSPRILPLLQRGAYAAFHRRVQLLLYAIGAAILLASFLLIRSGALHLFPTRFQESAGLLLILLIGNVMSFATFPLALPLVMFRRPRFTFLMDCIAFPFVAMLYWLAILDQGAEGAAWVTTASLLARGGLVQALAWRLSRAPLGPEETSLVDSRKDESS
jgi:O-antigen/teichoic acid export membrane protein